MSYEPTTRGPIISFGISVIVGLLKNVNAELTNVNASS